MRDSHHSKPKQGRGAALLTQDISLGPDQRLRVAALATPTGTAIELRVMRASPADRSRERFRPIGKPLLVPVSAYKYLLASLERVGQAATSHELWRPAPPQLDREIA